MTIDKEMTLMGEQLEGLIDKQGLHSVLELISSVCFEKATHAIRELEDKPLAQKWEAAAVRIEELSGNPKIRSVS